MKKIFKYFGIIAVVSLMAVTFLYNRTNNGTNDKLVNIISIASVQAEDSPSNTGPAYFFQCTKNFCKETHKGCRCENQFSCTESLHE